MKKNYLKIRIKIPQADQEMAADGLVAFGFNGFEQFDDVLEAWTGEELLTADVRFKICEWLERQSGGVWQIVGEEILQERNWNIEWEKTIRPQIIGRFFVHPTWSDSKPPAGTIPLVIDPKMAFGTGYHETTRLLLQLLPECVNEGDYVLDMGTGTGILAIAALKLGAGKALGVDIDPWSYENARDNTGLNGVSDRLDIRIGSTEMIPSEAQFDLILANINRNILLEMGEVLTSHMVPGGILMLSGILEEDLQAISEHSPYAAMKQTAAGAEGEWHALVLSK